MADAPQVVRRNFKQYDRDMGSPGLVVPTARGWAYTTFTTAAAQGRCSRFVPSRPMRFTGAAIFVTTPASVDDPCDVGIYDATGAKLVSAGATSGKMNVSARQTLTFTAAQVCSPNTAYYAVFGLGTQGGTAAAILAAGFVSAGGSRLVGGATGTFEVESFAAGMTPPLPSSLPANSGAAATGPAIFLIEG